MTRILGLDLGERRIGVAVADSDGIAMPLTTLRRAARAEDDAIAIARLLADEDATGITRDWVDAVEPHLPVPLRYRDERLSSHLAEQRLGPMKRGRSGGPPSKTQRDAYRARIDREAAAIILQDELDARAAHPIPDTEASP
jgi:RNase H-fold protein (predicted Holliday junction resolvase)